MHLNKIPVRIPVRLALGKITREALNIFEVISHNLTFLTGKKNVEDSKIKTLSSQAMFCSLKFTQPEQSFNLGVVLPF